MASQLQALRLPPTNESPWIVRVSTWDRTAAIRSSGNQDGHKSTRVASGSLCKPLASAHPSHIAQTQLFGEKDALEAAADGSHRKGVTTAPRITLALGAMA